MSQDPTSCTICGAPRPLYKLGLRGYCGKHRPGMREDVAIIARVVRGGTYGRDYILEPVVPAEEPNVKTEEKDRA